MGIVFIAAVVLGCAYLFLLKVMARWLIWIAIALSCAIPLFIGAVVFFHAPDIAAKTEFPLGDNTLFAIRCFASMLLFLGSAVVCLACCFARQAEISIACVQVGVDVMWANPSLLLSPLVKGVAMTTLGLLLLTGG